MSRKTILGILVVTLTLAGFAFARLDLGPGHEPYTPTRLEWMEMRGHAVINDPQAACFTSGDEEITVLVYHREGQKREEAAEQLARAYREQLMEEIQTKGWHGWLKVRAQTAPVDLPGPRGSAP